MRNFITNLFNLLFRQPTRVRVVIYLLLLSLFTSFYGYSVYFWLISCFLFYTIVPIRLDRMCLFISAWALTYSVLLFLNGGDGSKFDNLSYLMVPPIIYLTGKWIVTKLRDKENIILLLLLCIIAFGSILWILTLKDVSENGIITATVNRELTVNNQTLGVKATVLGLYATPAFVGFGYAIINFFKKFDNSKVQLLIFLTCAILSLITSVRLLNRTGIVIMVLSAMIMYFYSSSNNIIRLSFSVILICIFIYLILIQFDFFNQIVEVYANRDSGGDNSASFGGRLWRWEDAIIRVFYMPFGWYGSEYITGYNFAHNMWLDVGRQTGLMPFLLLVILSLLSLQTLWQLYKVKDNSLIMLIIGLNTCLLLGAFVEPLVEAIPFYLYFMFFLWGIQKKYLDMVLIHKGKRKNTLNYSDSSLIYN